MEKLYFVWQKLTLGYCNFGFWSFNCHLLWRVAVTQGTAAHLAFSVIFGNCGKCENEKKLYFVLNTWKKRKKKTLDTQPQYTPLHSYGFADYAFDGRISAHCVSFIVLHSRTVPKPKRHVLPVRFTSAARAYTFFCLFSDLAFLNVLRMCLCFGGLSFVRVIAYAW